MKYLLSQGENNIVYYREHDLQISAWILLEEVTASQNCLPPSFVLRITENAGGDERVGNFFPAHPQVHADVVGDDVAAHEQKVLAGQQTASLHGGVAGASCVEVVADEGVAARGQEREGPGRLLRIEGSA